MSIILIKALQLILCLSLLVILHEFGHFGFSKLFHVKVTRFYLFYNPYFHLFSTRDRWFTRLFPYFKDNETEYGIGWLPLGGYVQIAGMVDESMDTEQLKKPAQPWEFRSQKVWKRFFMMAGGILMNLLAAWVIYSAVMLTWGRDYIPMQSIKQGFQYNEYAQRLGFRNGDIPVAADGKEIAEYSGVIYRTLSNAGTVTVLRDGQRVNVQMPSGGLNMVEMLHMVPAFMSPTAPSVIESVAAGSAAEKAGMKAGAQILAVNGKDISTWNDFDFNVTLRRQDILGAPTCTRQDSLKQRHLLVVWTADGGVTKDTASLHLDETYLMGVTRRLPEFGTEHESYTLLSCIPAGLKRGWKQLSGYVNDLKYMASADGVKSVGSFITIGSIFPSAWDWQQFWLTTTFISIILAVMNLLPIPALDGGHLFFLLVEAITGRQPSEKVMQWMEMIGLGLLAILMLVAFSNDVRNFILPLFGF